MRHSREKLRLFFFHKLQKHPEIYDETNKKVFGKIKIEATDSIENYELVTLGAKACAYTKNNEVVQKNKKFKNLH